MKNNFLTLNKTLFVLAAATFISVGTSSFAQSYNSSTTPASMKTDVHTEVDSKGNYTREATSESKDETGTLVKDKVQVDVKKDSDGYIKKTVESKTIRDPKGLGNKSTLTSEQKVKGEDGNYESKNLVKQKNGETDTLESHETKIKVETDDEGNVEKSKVTTDVVDPKGLMNKSSVKTTIKEENKDGKKEYHQTKKVDGEVVEDKTIKSE